VTVLALLRLPPRLLPLLTLRPLARARLLLRLLRPPLRMVLLPPLAPAWTAARAMAMRRVASANARTELQRTALLLQLLLLQTLRRVLVLVLAVRVRLAK
jgi:hypothetical protein